MGKPIEIKQGDRYGRLTIVKEIEPKFCLTTGKMIRIFQCNCDCGNESIVRLLNIRNGSIKSCGCLQKEIVSKTASKHRQSWEQNKTSEYQCWTNMKQRCTNPKSKSWKYYGKIGIKVCDRWTKSFENFFDDMGKKPTSEYSIDRINVYGNYEPSNCRWATKSEQSKNQRRYVK